MHCVPRISGIPLVQLSHRVRVPLQRSHSPQFLSTPYRTVRSLFPLPSFCTTERPFQYKFCRNPLSYGNTVSRLQLARYTGTSRSMSLNGETRHKRKTSPVQAKDRPSKALKADPDNMNGSISPDRGGDYAYSAASMEDEILQQPITATADTAEWQATIEQVVKNVVSIHFCQTCSFDTDAAISSEATGFVVDAKRGYILTNRHVVGAGPFWGYCIFDNHEEVCILGDSQ